MTTQESTLVTNITKGEGKKRSVRPKTTGAKYLPDILPVLGSGSLPQIVKV